ncbi:O-antigen ligase family protein [Alicyclobacillus dauci]|uniref:O-antigen ligase family protein n=1 Tax=Alicyclobacillus dauci TaxID=1475485 RepID=A0ABY6Z1W0_9BACL|nr:O-antigen ligase family protein [Alicyclobacillus dauci]WAH36827.1 O-antigen ligase family protein [Alicyclobacillus dauci]
MKKAYGIVALLAALLLVSLIQNITIVSLGSGFNLKPYHILILLVALWSIGKGRIVFSVRLLPFWIAPILLVCVSLFDWVYFHMSLAGTFRAVIAFAGFLDAYFLSTLVLRAQGLMYRDILQGMRITVTVYFFSVYIIVITNAKTVIDFIKSPNGHPLIPTVVGGGVNIEATWLALLSVMFIRTRYFLVFGLLSTVYSILTASRAGIFAILLVYATDMVVRLKRKNMPVADVIGVLLIALYIVEPLLYSHFFKPSTTVSHHGGYTTQHVGYAAQRVADIGTDPGSTGRFRLWKWALESIKMSPITGFGIGDGIEVMRKLSNFGFSESNVHDFVLQFLVDTGIIGLATYIVWLVQIVRNKLPYEMFLAAAGYTALSLIQFEGYDVIFWLILGIGLAVSINCSNSKGQLREDA